VTDTGLRSAGRPGVARWAGVWPRRGRPALAKEPFASGSGGGMMLRNETIIV